MSVVYITPVLIIKVAMINAVNKWLVRLRNALDNTNHVLSIFIDLSKAFDTIDHKIPLRKLENNGIKEVLQMT